MADWISNQGKTKQITRSSRAELRMSQQLNVSVSKQATLMQCSSQIFAIYKCLGIVFTLKSICMPCCILGQFVVCE